MLLSNKCLALALQLKEKSHKNLTKQENREIVSLKATILSQGKQISSFEQQLVILRGVYNRHKGKVAKQHNRSAKALRTTFSTKKSMQLNNAHNLL